MSIRYLIPYVTWLCSIIADPSPPGPNWAKDHGAPTPDQAVQDRLVNERFSSVQVTGRGPSVEPCLRGLRAFHPAIAWPGLPGLGSMSAAGREIARWLRDGRFSLCDRGGLLCAGRRAWPPARGSSIGRSA